ncbi:MAG: hypothetical protein V4585_07005 [Bacteroidota bacterium]|jgi:hypothetical protein
MIRNTIFALIAAAIIIAININSSVVHIPLLIIFISAITLGYLQPQKGWITAIQLVCSIFAGFFIIKLLGITPKSNNIFQFITYISPFPCLFGGFMGSYFNKTLNQK